MTAEEFESRLMALVAEAEETGLDTDAIISALEICLMAQREQRDVD